MVVSMVHIKGIQGTRGWSIMVVSIVHIKGIQGTRGCLLYKVDNAAKTTDSWQLSEVRISVELFEVRQHKLVTEFILLLLAHRAHQHITICRHHPVSAT